MPFDGSGNFSRLYSWQSDRDNGIRILASKMDGEFNNFASGMNVVFFRNGLVPMSGNLNMGQNYLIGLGAGSAGALPIRFADDPNSGMFLNGISRPSLVANGVTRLEANTTGVIVTGTLNSTGNLSENGSRVWSAATFDPTTKANLAGATFTGGIQLNAGATYINGSYASAQLTTAGSTRMLGIDGTNTAIIGPADANINATINGGGGPTTVGGALTVTGALKQGANQVWHAGNLTPGNYALLSGAAFTGGVSGTTLTLTGLLTGAAATHTTLGLTGALTGTTGAFSSTLSAAGAITQNGNQVWHAGNFTPGNYATLASPALTGTPTTPTAAPGTNTTQIASTAFVAAVDALKANLSGAAFTGAVSVASTLSATGAITQNGNQVWHAGNLTPGNYALLTGAAFTGASSITATGDALSVGTATRKIYIAADSGGVSMFTGAAQTGNGLYSSALSNYTALFASSAEVLRASSGAVSVTGTLNTTGAITQNGSQVWHAGNFTPGNYATLASPALTGTPTAPTAAGGTNTTQIATTAFVTGALASYAPLASPAFTGTPTKSGSGGILYHSASGLSGVVSRGTAAPSGGSDGDIYLQYS